MIEQLTARQREIADTIWSLDEHQDVEAYIDSLPSREQYEARALILCMIQDGCEEDDDAVESATVEVALALADMKGVR